MLSFVMSVICVAGYICSCLITDHVLTKVKKESPEWYALILKDRDSSWVEHDSLLFPLNEFPIVLRVWKFILLRKEKIIVGFWVWFSFTVTFLLALVFFMKVLLSIVLN